jgi:hypothetical protein
MVYSLHDTVMPGSFPAKANRRLEKCLSTNAME